jgi:hypothetical protein
MTTGRRTPYRTRRTSCYAARSLVLNALAWLFMIFVGVAGCRSIKVPPRRKDLGLLKIHVAEPEGTFEVNLTSARQDPGPGGRGLGGVAWEIAVVGRGRGAHHADRRAVGWTGWVEWIPQPKPGARAEILVGRRVAVNCNAPRCGPSAGQRVSPGTVARFQASNQSQVPPASPLPDRASRSCLTAGTSRSARTTPSVRVVGCAIASDNNTSHPIPATAVDRLRQWPVKDQG